MAETPSPEPRSVSSEREIAERILFARPGENTLGRTIFLIGAGCSVSARIPDAESIAKRMVREVGRRFRCMSGAEDHVGLYRELVARNLIRDAGRGVALALQDNETIEWHRIYDEMFVRHYAAPDDTRELFGQIVAEAGEAINWAHLCLGELAKRRYISTVLTTNFDQLVLSGMVRAGLLPVVCDGIESLNRIAGAPSHPQLVELHGSRHTYLLRNHPDDVKAVMEDSGAVAAVQKLFQHATTFVVVGYGGREDGVMGLLLGAARNYRDKHLFWVQHSSDPKNLEPKARDFLATSRNSGLLTGRDADVFFLELCKQLEVGVPSAVSAPLATFQRLVDNLAASDAKDDNILSEIDSAKSQLGFMQRALDNRPALIDDQIARIREKRLSGDIDEAYRLAEERLKGK